MRVLVKPFLLLAVTILTIVSCGKKEDPYPPVYPGDVNGGGGTFGSYGAKMNGQDFNPKDSVAATVMNGMINITAIHNGSTLTITLQDDVLGIYNLDDTGNDGAAAYTKAGASNSYTTNAYSGDVPGTVEITKLDGTNKKISGTFSFVVEEPGTGDTILISQGSFVDVTFTGELPPIAGNSLTADIDGTPFAPATAAGMAAMGKLTITGTTGTEALSVTVPDNTATGTFTIDAFGNYTGLYVPNSGGTTSYLSESGSITITKHDVTAKRIEGTFSYIAKEFMGTDSVEITNGEFAVTY